MLWMIICSCRLAAFSNTLQFTKCRQYLKNFVKVRFLQVFLFNGNTDFRNNFFPRAVQVMKLFLLDANWSRDLVCCKRKKCFNDTFAKPFRINECEKNSQEHFNFLAIFEKFIQNESILITALSLQYSGQLETQPAARHEGHGSKKTTCLCRF